MAMHATDLIADAKEYLHQVVGMMLGTVRAELLIGPVAPTLAAYIGDLAITEVVMASHGRTGLPRLALGSVADSLIHRLSCPILVIPSLAATRPDRHEQDTSSLVAV